MRDLWLELPVEAPLEQRLECLAAYRASGARPPPQQPLQLLPPKARPAAAAAAAAAAVAAADEPARAVIATKRKPQTSFGAVRVKKKRAVDASGGLSLDSLRLALCAGGRGCRMPLGDVVELLAPAADADVISRALRFLARDETPGPFVARHDGGGEGPEWEWVGGAAEDEEHWWRYDVHGPPPRHHGEKEQLAAAQAGFAAAAAGQDAD
jgi:hypothetical protein